MCVYLRVISNVGDSAVQINKRKAIEYENNSKKNSKDLGIR